MIALNKILVATALVSLVAPAPPALASDDLQIEEAAMSTERQSAMLDVPGASIYYETIGSGPTVLLIPGGPQDAGVFVGLAEALADRFTVITYDPRGNSRTTVEGDLEDIDMAQQADDAAALIEQAGAPAFVFGTSGGGHIALELAVRHPDLVRSLVIHEPPSMMLLAEPEPALASTKALYETYKADGVEAAMAQFFGDNGLESGEKEEFDPSMLPPEAAETFMRVSGNFEYWLAHGMLPLSVYKPDVTALTETGLPFIVAIGEPSKGQPIEEMSLALAKALGVEPLAVPGDHSGFTQDPVTFAERISGAFE